MPIHSLNILTSVSLSANYSLLFGRIIFDLKRHVNELVSIQKRGSLFKVEEGENCSHPDLIGTGIHTLQYFEDYNLSVTKRLGKMTVSGWTRASNRGVDMPRTLGIFVSSDRHLDKIIEICKAAKNKNVDVSIFFTHRGTLLTQSPRFKELQGHASMSICKVGFESHGLKPPVVGIGDKDYGTQIRHGELIYDCDRYIVFQ